MELLREISDQNIGLTLFNKDIAYKIRKAARAVLLDNSNKIALLAVTKDNYHKLPGGGAELDEDIAQALIREVREEVGAEVQILNELGCIIEYRNEFKQLQLSYCYIARVVGKLSTPNYTEMEVNDGFQLGWHELEEALEILKQDQPLSYVGKFIVNRDKVFLEQAINQKHNFMAEEI